MYTLQPTLRTERFSNKPHRAGLRGRAAREPQRLQGTAAPARSGALPTGCRHRDEKPLPAKSPARLLHRRGRFLHQARSLRLQFSSGAPPRQRSNATRGAAAGSRARGPRTDKTLSWQSVFSRGVFGQTRVSDVTSTPRFSSAGKMAAAAPFEHYTASAGRQGRQHFGHCQSGKARRFREVGASSIDAAISGTARPTNTAATGRQGQHSDGPEPRQPRQPLPSAVIRRVRDRAVVAPSPSPPSCP